MAKKKDVFDLDDDEKEKVDEQPAELQDEQLKEQQVELAKLLDAPRTLEVGGDGPGGRPYVLTKQGLRQPRQGDQSRPRCPICSNDQLAVLTSAVSSPKGNVSSTTWYKCPRCSFSAQRLRPGMAEQFRRQAESKPARPFVERPS